MGNYQFLCLLQPTSPFRTKNTLKHLEKKFNPEVYDSVLTVKSVHNLYWDNSKYAKPLYKTRKMRQDLNNFAESGMYYKSKIESINSNQNRVSGKTLLIKNKEIESIEIDSIFDLKIANSLIPEAEKEWKKEILEAKINIHNIIEI